MPGIVGLLTAMPRERAETQLKGMVEAIRHGPEYETGVYIDESQGVYVGWATRAGSFSDGMPLCNERGDVVLIFSGEEFSAPDLARRLKERGHEVGTRRASYLVHVYEEDGAFPATLNGRFHGFVIDRACGTATLFNDRYGMHKVYYHEAKEGFYFAAEAKAILAVRPELRAADPRGLGELISCGCVMEDRTLFKGIRLLPPGSSWVSRDGSITERNTYFDRREWETLPSLEPESYYKELQRVFSDKLALYFKDCERIGMSLTGGLDTRMIMAWQKCSPNSLPCYTFGSMYRDCRDVVVAREVARAARQQHEVIPVGSEFLSRFAYYAERTVFLSDGCVDVSRAPTLYANQKARATAPIRMTGIYGSEILRGVRSFKPGEPAASLFRPELLSQVHAAKETYSSLLNLHPLSFTAFSQTPQRALDVLEQSQLSVRYPFLDNDVVRTAFRGPDLSGVKNDALADNDVCLRLICAGDAAFKRIRTDRGLGGASRGIAAWAAQSFHNFTFKSEYAYDYGMPQFVARMDHLLSSFRLERLFLGRHKFYHFRVWYRDSLSKYVQEMLLDPRTLSRPYLKRSGVEAVVRGHLKGNRNYTSEIHRLLSLELLHRLFVDAE